MLRSCIKKICLIMVLCLITCVALSKPITSYATKACEPTSSAKVSSVDNQYYNNDTSAINSNDKISTEVLNDNLSTTKVVGLTSFKDVVKYLINRIGSKNKNSDEILDKVDNSKNKYFPPIIDQGELNSCTTWSTVYYQMSYAVNKALDRDGSITANQFSPTWIYNMANEGENKGNYYSDILKILAEIGAVTMEDVPAITTDEGDNVRNVMATKDLWMKASKYRVKEYYSLDIGNDEDVVITSPQDKDLKPIKQALSYGEVLTATTYVYKWNRDTIKKSEKQLENRKYNNEYIVTSCDNRLKGAHRVTIVGYNDDIWFDINENGKVEEAEKGAFKIANSYGDELDNEGFVWMSYDAINKKSALSDESETVSEDREAGLFDIIGYNIDLDETEDLYGVLSVDTMDLKSVNVKITAKDKKGRVYEFEPAPFTNAMIRGMGEYPFNSNQGGNVGEFYIDMSHVVKEVTSKNVFDYKWDIEVADTSSENSVIINDFKLYDKKGDGYTGTFLDSPIELNNEMVNIKINSVNNYLYKIKQKLDK